MSEPPRLRMFAGPNGSGKTTIKEGLNRSPDWFGVLTKKSFPATTVRCNYYRKRSSLPLAVSYLIPADLKRGILLKHPKAKKLS